MTQMLPAARPQMTREDAEQHLSLFDLSEYKVKLLGIRGYFKDTMGEPGTNDRGIYDDAIMIISPSFYGAFNANTDPSRHQPGVAVLKAGKTYLYRIGMHGVSGPAPYLALRQFGNVTVVRDGQGEATDSPASRFWIDIHRGGYTTTSSLGCQTIHPDQWKEFFERVGEELKRYAQNIIPYTLIEI